MARTCGTASTYNAGCRCDDCRRASREARRRIRRAKPVPIGTRVMVDGRTYGPWRCPYCGETFARPGTHPVNCLTPGLR